MPCISRPSIIHRPGLARQATSAMGYSNNEDISSVPFGEKISPTPTLGPQYESDSEKAMGASNEPLPELQRRLKSRHLQMIAIGMCGSLVGCMKRRSSITDPLTRIKTKKCSMSSLANTSLQVVQSVQVFSSVLEVLLPLLVLLAHSSPMHSLAQSSTLSSAH